MAALIASGFDKDRMAWAAAVMAPLICVQFVRLLDGGLSQAPAATTATSGSPAVIPPATEARRLTKAQIAALEFLQSDALRGEVRSPMNHPVVVASPPPSPEPAPASPAIDPVKALTLTAVMGTENQAVASIGHTLRRVGDEVAPGWRVAEINARQRTVQLRHLDGRTLTLQPAP